MLAMVFQTLPLAGGMSSAQPGVKQGLAEQQRDQPGGGQKGAERNRTIAMVFTKYDQ